MKMGTSMVQTTDSGFNEGCNDSARETDENLSSDMKSLYITEGQKKVVHSSDSFESKPAPIYSYPTDEAMSEGVVTFESQRNGNAPRSPPKLNYAGAGVSSFSINPTVKGRGRGRGKWGSNPNSPVVKPKNVQMPQKDLTITDLDENDMTMLAKYLDVCRGSLIKNWEHVAMALNINAHDRIALQSTYHGGGNPALVFLNKLSKEKKDCDVASLITNCKKIERNDIVMFMQNENVNTKLVSISHGTLENLAAKLTEKNPVIKCWKHLASQYGYSRVDIDAIGSQIRTPGLFSPTKALIMKITTMNAAFTLEQFKTILRGIERNDVVKALDDIIKNKINKMP